MTGKLVSTKVLNLQPAWANKGRSRVALGPVQTLRSEGRRRARAPLADGLDVVVDAAAGLATLEQAALHLGLGTLKVEHKRALTDLPKAGRKPARGPRD